MKSKPLSLFPLTFEEAVSALVKSKPEDRPIKWSRAAMKVKRDVLKDSGTKLHAEKKPTKKRRS